MSAIAPIALSDRLLHPLKELSQRRWTLVAARGLLRTLAMGLGVLLFSSLVLGYLPRLVMPLRVILAALTWAVVLRTTFRSLRPAFARWSLGHAALQADSTLPESHERLSSAIELSQAEEMFRGSPELVQILVRQAETDAVKIKAADVVPFASLGHWMAAFLPVLALWAFFALWPRTATPVLRGLFSLLMPWKTTPTELLDIAVLPGDATIDEGDAFKIQAALSMPGHGATLVRAFPATGQEVSQSLDQTAATRFAMTFSDVRTSFRYKINTDDGNFSNWFSLTVHPRPSITRLDVNYDYPKYTGLEPRTYTASDGNIEAVVGTRVTLTIHTADALVLDKSQLIFDEGKPSQSTVPLVASAEKNVFTAQFTVDRNREYRIALLNEYNLGPRDADLRVVTAEEDQKPTIEIIAPHDEITVRDDDEVIVEYTAGDDYGIASIQALLQVDDRPQFAVPLPIHSDNRKAIEAKWTLLVDDVIKKSGATEGSRITYQLQATDNRDPDPQSTFSMPPHVLIVTHQDQKSFQEKLNEKRKDDLIAAIRRAIIRLNEDNWKVAQLRDEASRSALTADRLKADAELRDRLGVTSKSLSNTAAEYLDTPFAAVAGKAKAIADGDIAASAEDTARIALDAADAQAARADGDKAFHEVQSAREALERLIEKVEMAERKSEAAEELKQAARKQEQVARDMKEHPEKVQQNQQKQEQAIRKLDEAMAKDPSLQNQSARELASKLNELQQKVDREQEKQAELQQQTSHQQDKQQAEQAANKLLDDQKKLDQKVQQFAKDQKSPIEHVQAHVPDENQQKSLEQNIENNRLQQAAQEAQRTAEELKHDADRLKEQAEHPTPSQERQQALNQAKQTQQQSMQARNQAKQAADAMKRQSKASQLNTDAQHQVTDRVADAAEAVKQQANKIEQENQQNANDPAVQKQAEEAKADADKAAQDARASGAADNPPDAQASADKAAEELAQATEELTDAAKQAVKADKDKAKAKDDGDAAQVAQAADAAKDLAKEQRQIAKALEQEARQQTEAQQGTPPQQQTADEQRNLANQTQEAKQAAQQLKNQAAEQKDMSLADRAESATKALDAAAKSQQQAAAAEAEQKPDAAADAQADAQKSLAQAQQALRGAAEAMADSNPETTPTPPDGAKPDRAQNKPDPSKAEVEAAKHQQTAAQAAQEAAQAQRRALQPNADAARQAAQELAKAASAAQQSLPGQGQPMPGEEAAADAGQDPSAADHTGMAPGATPDSKEGITGTDTGGSNKAPASVLALGISASDWAKLPPLMQSELANAAQHSGPPAYKSMIKNYYVRVARMQSDQPATNVKQ